MSTEVFTATPGDAHTLAELWLDFARALAEEDPARFRVPDPAGLSEWFRGMLLEPLDDERVFLAQVDGAPAGFAVARVIRPGPDARFQPVRTFDVTRGMLESIGVASAHRGTGVGAVLLDAVEAWMRARGVVHVMLHTGIGTDAARFYERAGYRSQTGMFEKAL